MAQVTIAMRFFVSTRAWVEVQPAHASTINVDASEFTIEIKDLCNVQIHLTRQDVKHKVFNVAFTWSCVAVPTLAVARQSSTRSPRTGGGGGRWRQLSCAEKEMYQLSRFHCSFWNNNSLGWPNLESLPWYNPTPYLYRTNTVPYTLYMSPCRSCSKVLKWWRLQPPVGSAGSAGRRDVHFNSSTAKKHISGVISVISLY